MTGSSSMPAGAATHVRYLVLAMLFIVSTVNYADRAATPIWRSGSMPAATRTGPTGRSSWTSPPGT